MVLAWSHIYLARIYDDEGQAVGGCPYHVEIGGQQLLNLSQQFRMIVRQQQTSLRLLHDDFSPALSVANRLDTCAAALVNP